MNAYTSDLSDSFFARLREVARVLHADPHDMLSVMFSESGARADAHNANGDASGLIQFMPATLTGVGWVKGHAAFRALGAAEQLTYVERYYAPYIGYIDTIAGLYVATFLPALIFHAHESDYVLTSKNGRLPWAYSANAVFDANHDLAITVRELEDAVVRNCKGARWAEIERRLAEGVTLGSDAIDLSTTIGIQKALLRAGYDPGPLDGIAGKLTRAAVVEFQKEKGLVPDGIPGPLTRAALKVVLNSG